MAIPQFTTLIKSYFSLTMKAPLTYEFSLKNYDTHIYIYILLEIERYSDYANFALWKSVK